MFHTLNFARVWFLVMHEGQAAISFGEQLLATPEGQYTTMLHELAQSLVIDGHLMLVRDSTARWAFMRIDDCA